MNILISGAASGIGRAVSERFLEEGHTVFALDIAEIPTRERQVSFIADITKEEELMRVLDALKEEGTVLDVILCVAGIHRMASLVESETTDLKRVVEVNLVGTMLTCRLFHECLAPRGRVVIVTSEVAAFDPLPFNGLYNVSKTALDAYAQALRQELGLLGQSVVTIRPGAIETALSRSSLTATEALAEHTVLYQKQSHHFLALVKNFMGKPMSAEKLAKTVYRAATKRHARLIYNVHHNIGLRLLSILPKRIQCFIIRLLLNRE